MKKSIPNIITLLNLVCGFLSIISLMNGEYILSAYLILTAVFFDILDGLVARALHVSSSIGKDLDSLSDLVSFGVAPALLIHELFFDKNNLEFLGLVVCVGYALFGAYRLARFNNLKTNDKNTNHFKGLPITFSGITMAFVALNGGWIHPLVALLITAILMVLMVTTLKIPNLKKGNIHLKIFLLFVVIYLLLKVFIK